MLKTELLNSKLNHAGDTVASKIAADYMALSGKLTKNRHIVLNAITENHLNGGEPMTGGEIAEKSGLDRIEAQRRTSDLKNMGIVHYLDEQRRKCSVRGTIMSPVELVHSEALMQYLQSNDCFEKSMNQ